MAFTLKISGTHAGRAFEGRIHLEYDEAMAFVWMLRRMTPFNARDMALDEGEAWRMFNAGNAIKAAVERVLASNAASPVRGGGERFYLGRPASSYVDDGPSDAGPGL